MIQKNTLKKCKTFFHSCIIKKIIFAIAKIFKFIKLFHVHVHVNCLGYTGTITCTIESKLEMVPGDIYITKVSNVPYIQGCRPIVLPQVAYLPCVDTVPLLLFKMFSYMI